MDLAGLGQKVKQTHPEYQDIPDHELGQKVVAKYPQYGSMVTASNGVVGAGQHVSDFLRKIHLQLIPDMAGTLYGAGQEALQGKNPTAIPGGPQPTSEELTKNYQNNPFMTMQEGQKTGGGIGDIAAQSAKGALGVGAYLAPFAAAPLAAAGAGAPLAQTVGTGLANLGIQGAEAGAMFGGSGDKVTPGTIAKGAATGAISNMVVGGALKTLTGGWMSKSALANMTTKSAEDATKQGVAFSLDDVKQTIIDEATKGGKDTTEMSSALDDMFKNKLSQDVIDQGYMTPSDLLNLRRNLTTSEGGNLFQQILSHLQRTPGSGADLQAAKAARNVASDLVHQSAPGSLTPDQVYSLYKKIGGSPAEWLKRIGVGVAVDRGQKALGIKNPTINSALDVILGGLTR